MASDIWLRTVLIVRKETRCHHIGYSYRLTARVLLYAPSHKQDNTYHGLCYTSRGALAGTRNSSMGPHHEGSIRRPIAPWANALRLSYVPLPLQTMSLMATQNSVETQERDVQLRGKSVRSWCDGSSDRSFMGWTHWAISRSSQCSTNSVNCNKGRVCGMVHIKEPLLLFEKCSPWCGSGFPLSLSDWYFTICPTPYNRK